MAKKCKKNKPCNGAMELHRLYDPFLSGLLVVNTMHKETYEKGVRLAYGFPKGFAHKGNIYLNYCPWCGVDQSFKSA